MNKRLIEVSKELKRLGIDHYVFQGCIKVLDTQKAILNKNKFNEAVDKHNCISVYYDDIANRHIYIYP